MPLAAEAGGGSESSSRTKFPQLHLAFVFGCDNPSILINMICVHLRDHGTGGSFEPNPSTNFDLGQSPIGGRENLDVREKSDPKVWIN